MATGFPRPDDFARAIGIQPAKYRRIEDGAAEPDLLELKKIAEVTGRSIDWLVMGTEVHR